MSFVLNTSGFPPQRSRLVLGLSAHLGNLKQRIGVDFLLSEPELGFGPSAGTTETLLMDELYRTTGIVYKQYREWESDCSC